MDMNGLLDIFKQASRSLVKQSDRCEHLVYTQTRGTKGGDMKIREPEARYALSLVLAKNNIRFGHEVPTANRYNFTKKPKSKGRKGRIDIALWPGPDRQVNIELKEGQPSVEPIRKDIEKLYKEPSHGSAIFHVLQNSYKNSATLTALLEKYCKGYEKVVQNHKGRKKWFLLFIFVKDRKESHWKKFQDITTIQREDLKTNLFSIEPLTHGDVLDLE